MVSDEATRYLGIDFYFPIMDIIYAFKGPEKDVKAFIKSL
jgi:hypothetical protein